MRARRLIRPALHRPNCSLEYEVLGSGYGGWPVLVNSLNSSSVVYSFGVGEDISFDMGVMERYSCKVKAFDPTPRSVKWIEQQDTPDLFEFHPVGLSDRTQILSFSAPLVDSHVSFTEGMQTSSSERIQLPVRSLAEIMEALGDSKLDFLKMDIEGSEYSALSDIVSRSIFPTQLCVEFHHGMYGFTSEQTRATVSTLFDVGYRLFYVSEIGREYGFCR